jgi:hypothetical protein
VTVLSNVALPNNHFGDFGWGWGCDRVALYHVHQLYTGVQSFRTCEVWTHHAGGSTVGTHVAHIALVAHFWTLPQFASCPTFRPQTHTHTELPLNSRTLLCLKSCGVWHRPVCTETSYAGGPLYSSALWTARTKPLPPAFLLFLTSMGQIVVILGAILWS